MKATGIVRKLDTLDRICLPKDMCKRLNITKGDPVEFLMDDNGIYLRKFDRAGDMEQVLDNFERMIHENDSWLEGNQLDSLLDHVRQMRQIVQE